MVNPENTHKSNSIDVLGIYTKAYMYITKTNEKKSHEFEKSKEGYIGGVRRRKRMM